jgi:membrane protein DedA with SNARE-associated domain
VLTLTAFTVSPEAAYEPLLYLSLFLTTFLHEGTAIATGAMLLVQQQSSPILTAACLAGGIVTGDLGIYGLGALARRSEWLQRRLGVAKRLQQQSWFGNRLIPTVAMCRVVPGVLFPTFLSYGWCGVPFRRFAATTVLVTGIYVPLLLTLFVQFGKQMAPLVQHVPWILLGAAVIAVTAFAARHVWTRHRERALDGQSLGQMCPLPAV